MSNDRGYQMKMMITYLMMIIKWWRIDEEDSYKSRREVSIQAEKHKDRRGIHFLPICVS
jgi:hypothetical protein